MVAAGAGYGAEKIHEDYFKGVSAQVADNFEKRGAKHFAPIYAEGASRVQFQEKDPRGWRLFADRLAQHDARGAANTMRGVQMQRPSLYDLEAEFRAMQTPVHPEPASWTVRPLIRPHRLPGNKANRFSGGLDPKRGRRDYFPGGTDWLL